MGKKITLAISIALLTFLLIVPFLSYNYYKRAIKENYFNHLITTRDLLKLQIWNYFNERYGDNGKKYVEELFFDVNKSKAVWLSRQLGHNDYQLVKNLRCFLYQACEGDAVKKSLYKTLVEIQNNFNGSLVNEHPQYQEVKWG